MSCFGDRKKGLRAATKYGIKQRPEFINSILNCVRARLPSRASRDADTTLDALPYYYGIPMQKLSEGKCPSTIQARVSPRE
jgi:hypothetical protein